MKYSFTSLALAVAVAMTPVFANPAVHHHHNHAHGLQARAAEPVDNDVEVVYVTKTVWWEDPVATPSTYSSSTSIPTTPAYKPVQTPVYYAQVAGTPAKSTTLTTSTKPPAAATPSAAATTYATKSPSSGSSSGTNTVDSLVTIAESALKSMLSLGVCSVGTNAVSNTGSAWIGTNGDYTVNMVNWSDEDLVILIWGPLGSWVNVKTPTITISVAKGASKMISFANGFSGAFAAIYSDTKLVNGQISNTWGECTFTEQGVCDVSREVNMSGHNLSISNPSCTSDMNTCVFVCDTGNVCTTGYSLKNCATGSQPGAMTGVDTYGNGGASGGCGWLRASKVAITATFS